MSESEPLGRPAGRAYRRPSGWWPRLVNRLLGPVPADAEEIDYRPGEFARMPSRWPVSVAAVFLVIGGVVGLQLLVPATGNSPVTVALGQRVGDWVVLIAVTLLVVLLAVRRWRGGRPLRQSLERLALIEEKWFRLGAEQWTGRQRIGSCIAFGLAHLLNLIYVVATLGMLALAGALFMAVYLYEMRSVADRRRAVIIAAKVHAQYNLIVLTLLIMVLIITWGWFAVDGLRLLPQLG